MAGYVEANGSAIDSSQIYENRNSFRVVFDDESGLKEATEYVFSGDLEDLFGIGIYNFFEETELLYEQLFDVTGSGYTMDFVMPGTLTYANGAIVGVNLVRWNVETEKFFASPYIMEAESRVMNLWAWIVSAVFVVFVFIGLFKGKRN